MKFARPAALAAASALVTTVVAQADYDLRCVDGLHVIGVRGSLEAPGFGLIEPVIAKIVEDVPGSDSRWVQYTATLEAYFDSQKSGVGNLTNYIKEYVDACPCHKIALVGLSQGAHAIGDTLIGPGYPNITEWGVGPGIGQEYVDAIAAVILHGDPSHVVGAPVNVGNATRDGFFPRTNSDNWADYGLVGKVESYCTAEDTFCDRGQLGSESLVIHQSYTRVFGNASADFVIDVWNNSTTKNTCPGGNGTSTNGTIGSGNNDTSRDNATGATTTPPTPTGAATRTGASTALLLALLAAVL